MTSRTASISTVLPDAGKPVSRCEECGPHGNGGRVELLFSVVDCLVCAWRADFDALRKVDDFDAELRSQAQPGEKVAVSQEISPLDPARVWGRRVKVTCTYSPAPTGAPPPTAAAITVEPCALCRCSTVGDAHRLDTTSHKLPTSFYLCGQCYRGPLRGLHALTTDLCQICTKVLGGSPRVVHDPKVGVSKWSHADPADCGGNISWASYRPTFIGVP